MTKKTKVHLVSQASPHLASTRMRVDKPLEVFKGDKEFEVSAGPLLDPTADIAVFSKHFTQKYMIETAQCCRIFGIKTIFDVCDDHFSNSKFDKFYKNMSELVDLVTVCGPNLQLPVKKVADKDALVIKDPITFPEYEPTSLAGDLRIVWYGHQTNLAGLERYIFDLPKFDLICNKIMESEVGNVNSIMWKEGLVESKIKDYDVVILPLSHDKMTKNSNRAVDALHAGRFVITDARRVYGELADYIYIGDMTSGLEWVENNREEARQMVIEGQKYVKNNYSDEVIKENWKEAFKHVLT